MVRILSNYLKNVDILLQKKGKLAEAKVKWEACKKYGPWWRKKAAKQIAVINKKLEAK